MTHVAWDFGALAGTIKLWFGVTLEQKTSKTLCGVRVPMARIDNAAPTCPACVEEVALREAEAQVLREELGR